VTAPDAKASLRRLDDYVRGADYTGSDPYDGLLSPVARLARGRRSRQAIVQGVKRFPLDLRPVARVRPVRMAKALALFSSGLARADFLPDASARQRQLADDLARFRRSGAWGYEFDVQTRWAFYPAGTPNIIATAFVIEALNDGRLTAQDDLAIEWLIERMVHPAGFIRYVPGNDRLIHNANVLGARALHRLSPGHPAVARSVVTTMERQRPDGLWRYGEGDGLDWVDNFHTAYVLLALRDLASAQSDIANGLARAVGAWADRCFEPDGTPRYYADRAGHRDVHNLSTAVHTLSVFAAEDEHCAELLPGAVSNLLACQRADGAFVASRTEPPYMRWNQAHAFRALSEIVHRTSVAHPTTGS
jgi:hypothetical protein